MARHADYSASAEVARGIQVPAGVFLVRAEIHPQDRVFSLDGLAPHPLSELPRILREQYGLADKLIPVLGVLDGQQAETIRRVGQDIMLVPVYTLGFIFDDWLQLADDYDAIARAEGVNVYFPAFLSGVQFLPGDWAPAVYSTDLPWSDEGTWEHRGGQGARRRLAQDVLGRLRDASDTGPVSLALAGVTHPPGLAVRAGAGPGGSGERAAASVG